MAEQNIKLLIFSSVDFFSTYGGGQVYVKNLVDELVRQGQSPIIATPGTSTAQTESYKGCAIYTFDASIAQKDFNPHCSYPSITI